MIILRYVYWGEYPLSFAACLGQEECYRLILARGADPNGQDTNGNTVLHMLVIYEKLVSIFFFFFLVSYPFRTLATSMANFTLSRMQVGSTFLVAALNFVLSRACSSERPSSDMFALIQSIHHMRGCRPGTPSSNDDRVTLSLILL